MSEGIAVAARRRRSIEARPEVWDGPAAASDVKDDVACRLVRDRRRSAFISRVKPLIIQAKSLNRRFAIASLFGRTSYLAPRHPVSFRAPFVLRELSRGLPQFRNADARSIGPKE